MQSYLGFAKQRSLPKWRSDTFLATTDVDQKDATVVIFADTFSNNFEPELLHAARRVLEAAGHRVAVAWPTLGAPALCCGRTFLATGQVMKAKSEARRLLQALLPFVAKGVPVVGLEPSCLFTLRDEFLAMGLGEEAQAVCDNAFLFEEFLVREKKAGRLKLELKALPQKTALAARPLPPEGVRRHERRAGGAVAGAGPRRQRDRIRAAAAWPAASATRPSTTQTSIAMAELSLLPAVRKADPDALIVADGTSCRHQIADGSNRQAVHVAEVLAQALATSALQRRRRCGTVRAPCSNAQVIHIPVPKSTAPAMSARTRSA